MIDLSKEKDFSKIKLDSNKMHLICLHGGPGLDASYFRSSLHCLEPDIEAIVYDQGCFVKNPQYKMDELVKELYLIYQSLREKTENIGLLAHSFGGLLALELLSRYHIKMPSIFVSWIYDWEWLSLVNEKCKPEDLVSYPISDEATCEEKMQNRLLTYIKMYFSESFKKEGENILRSIQCRPKWTDNLQEHYLQKADFKKFILSLDFPILSIAGKEDKVIYPEYYANIHLNKNIVHHFIEGVHHFPFIENPKSFRELAVQYIKQTQTIGGTT